MVTGRLGSHRRKQSGDSGQQQQQQHIKMRTSDAQLYRDLAQASGGLDIEVSKSELPLATSIITDSSSSPLVLTLSLVIMTFLNSK